MVQIISKCRRSQLGDARDQVAQCTSVGLSQPHIHVCIVRPDPVCTLPEQFRIFLDALPILPATGPPPMTSQSQIEKPLLSLCPFPRWILALTDPAASGPWPHPGLCRSMPGTTRPSTHRCQSTAPWRPRLEYCSIGAHPGVNSAAPAALGRRMVGLALPGHPVHAAA